MYARMAHNLTCCINQIFYTKLVNFRNAVNIYGILFGNLSFKNTVLLSAAYDFIKSSENGFSSVRPRYALILMDAIHISVTTIIFATVLLTDASELILLP